MAVYEKRGEFSTYASLRRNDQDDQAPPVMKILGIGGAGGYILNRVTGYLPGIESIAVDTDPECLRRSSVGCAVLLDAVAEYDGRNSAVVDELILGIRSSAAEKFEQIRVALQGVDVVFLVAGMGGQTGTIVAPVLADICKELGILTIAVVTRPFKFEGRTRLKIADFGCDMLLRQVNCLIPMDIDLFLTSLEARTTFNDALEQIDEMIVDNLTGIARMSAMLGRGKVDKVMKHRGLAVVGLGRSDGENPLDDALDAACSRIRRWNPGLSGHDVYCLICGRESDGGASTEMAAARIIQPLGDNLRIDIALKPDTASRDVEVFMLYSGTRKQGAARRNNVIRLFPEKQ